MGLLKERITAEKAGFYLVALLIESARKLEESGSQGVHELAEKCEVDVERLYREIVYLRAFSVQFATTQALGATSLRNAVLDSFYQWLRRAAADMASVGIDNGRVFYQGVTNRVPGYAEAARLMAYEETKGMKLGDLFATFCGGDGDFLLSLHGFFKFVTMQKAVRRFIESVRITAS